MRSERRTACVTKRRDVRPHAEFWHTSGVLLQHGQERQEGSTHQFRASLVFTAFSLEAYLNWLGQNRVPNWKYLERLSPREKTEVVANQFGIPVDFGNRPWSIVTQLFTFRNDIAHGKPESLEDITVERVDERLDRRLGVMLRTEWERFCTQENAMRAREDVEAIAKRLHDAAKFDDSESTDPFFSGFQTHSATIK